MTTFCLTAQHIREFESLIRSEFGAFRALYKLRSGADAICGSVRRPTVDDPVWTCFINGNGKGITVKGWRGIFSLWLARYSELGLDRGVCEIKAEAWYRVDNVVLDISAGGWDEGTYRLLVAFEQENNPKEIEGHTRSMFDLAIPDKMLLIWTRYGTRSGADNLIERADKIVKWCAKKHVANVGRLWILVGDWPVLARQLTDPTLPSESFLKILEVAPTSSAFEPATPEST